MILSLVACMVQEEEPPAPPLGMILAEDGQAYAGAAVVDITPEIIETFTDLNGNHHFDGCIDLPEGGTDACPEPFDDVNGNGRFEPVWIGGFGPLRPANSVRDPISVRAVVLSFDGDYIAFVTSDLVGLHSRRIDPAIAALTADGMDPESVIVTSSHNHQGPDTLGLWGDPLGGVPGFSTAYQERVTEAIERAVREAAGAMEPVTLRVGATAMRDWDPALNGSLFGGINPDPRMLGMIHDSRDPVIVSDQLLVLQGTGQETVFTMTSWSGHPEVRGSGNNALSADWPGVTREVIEAHVGGIALHLPESLGGMQSALGGELPLITADGEHQFQEDGTTPVWAERNSWDFVTSHGWLIAEAALATLDEAEEMTPSPIRVETASFTIPVESFLYLLLAPAGIFDLPLEEAIRDIERCPEAAVSPLGCLEASTARIRIGPIGLITAPGELLPELAWGLPADPVFLEESEHVSARGPGSLYFPQHDRDCDSLETYAVCRAETSVGACDCTRLHAWPYRLSDSPSLSTPMLDRLGEMPYRAVVGCGNSYLSYIIPEPDYNEAVTIPGDGDGDHYEDTVSPSGVFGTRLLEAQAAIDERW